MSRFHYDRMIRGDLSEFDAARLAADPGWGSAMDALRQAHMEPQPSRPAAPTTDAGWLAVRQYVLACGVTFCAEALGGIDGFAGGGAVGQATRDLARAWLSILGGGVPADFDTRPLESLDAGVIAERAALAALAASNLGQVEDALKLARRASRMASAEGVLQMEYLSNVVLARVRRRAGDGHLAIRILAALKRVVPPMWRGWVELELVLAGDPNARPPQGPWPAFVAPEVEARRTMLGQGTIAAAEPWCSAKDAFAPFGIVGPPAHPLFAAAMVIRPEQQPRRMFMAATSEFDLVAGAPRNGRLRLAICLLATENGNLSPSELFAQVYGFQRVDSGHDDLLRGLLHRVRKALAGYGEVVREHGHIRFVCQRAFVVPDPRCERSLEERILTFLAASSGRAPALEIAKQLGVPLRSIQRSLTLLVQEGTCERQRHQRTEYVLEDTTFTEPTLERLRGFHS